MASMTRLLRFLSLVFRKDSDRRKEEKMGMFDYFIEIIVWALIIAGFFMILWGAFQVWQAFGESGTGSHRVDGVVKIIGGVALIAMANAIPYFITAPPTYRSEIVRYATAVIGNKLWLAG